MPAEHVSRWLSAYHDQELSAAQCRLVEAHLDGCAQCREELQSLYRLSALLEASPEAAPGLSQEQFSDAVVERLPGSRPGSLWRRVLWMGWWAIPLALVSAWAFQSVLAWISSLLLFTDLTGWFPLERWDAVPKSLQMLLVYWLQLVGSLVGQLTPLGLGARWLSDELMGIWSSAMLVLLLASWLASWWMLHNNDLAGARAGTDHR